MTEKEFDKPLEIIAKLLKGKVDSYEIYLSSQKGLTVEVKEACLDSMRVHSSRGLGLRIIANQRHGFGYSSNLDSAALEAMVMLTKSSSSSTAYDKFLCFPQPEKTSVEARLDIFDSSYEDTTEEDIIAKALLIEEAAIGFDEKVKRVRKASYSESSSFSKTVNSNGVDCVYEGTFFSGSVMAVAETNGDSQIGWDVSMGHKRADMDLKAVGRGAAERAVGMLGAKPIKTVKCPAIFENAIAIELLEALAGSFLSDNVDKHKSMFAGKVGKKVASPVVGLYDDGLLPGGWATSVYDCEGALKTKTPLILEGTLSNYLYDTYQAKKNGVKSTGNAVRGGIRGAPTVGITNLYMEKGSKSLKQLLREMDRGLLIRDVMGAHTINTVSGEFSVGASGFWVENGAIAYPVRGIAIAGNLLELFSKVIEVGSDMRFMGSIGAGSILVSEINASGA